MKGLIHYSLRKYIRSHKYFPPLAVFIVFIFVFYTYKPNPILDSYAVTGLLVYVISAWLCISVLSTDPPVERQLLILHIGGKNRYLFGKLLSIFILSLLLTTYAFLYPIIFGMFNERVTIIVGFIAIMNHLLLAVLGIAVASLFSNILMKNTINSFGGLALVLTLSFTSLGIYEWLPKGWNSIVWLLPPALSTQKPLFDWSGDSIFTLSAYPFIWILVYSVIIISVFLATAKRKG